MLRSIPTRASLLSVVVLSALLAHPAGGQVDHSWVQTWEPNGAAAGKVFDDEVLQKLRDRLGGIATKIQVVTSACHSEYFAREGSRLNGDWSSAASRGIRILEDNTWSSVSLDSWSSSVRTPATTYSRTPSWARSQGVATSLVSPFASAATVRPPA